MRNQDTLLIRPWPDNKTATFHDEWHVTSRAGQNPCLALKVISRGRKYRSHLLNQHDKIRENFVDQSTRRQRPLVGNWFYQHYHHQYVCFIHVYKFCMSSYFKSHTQRISEHIGLLFISFEISLTLVWLGYVSGWGYSEIWWNKLM